MLQKLVRARWRALTIGALACVLLVAGITAVGVNAASSATASQTAPPFSAGSPFNQPIGANPQLDPNSGQEIAAIAAGQHVGLLHEYADPVVTADGTAPQTVHVENHWAGYYEGPVPFPADAGGSVGSDGALVVLDPANGFAYDFWRVKHTSSGWSAGYGSRFSLAGDGIPGHGATGSDIPLLDGVIRTGEIEAGEIRHALSIATQDTCSSFRYPASKSDGHGTGPSCLSEGSRLQLDPSFNCKTLSPAALVAVCGALEHYGAYVKDTSGSAISIGFQDAGPVTGSNPYYQAGWHADYPSIGIPWSRVRVLAAWNSGSPTEPPKEETPSAEPPKEETPSAEAPHTPAGCSAVSHREGEGAYITLSCSPNAPEDHVSKYVLYRAGEQREGVPAGGAWAEEPGPAFSNRLLVKQRNEYCYRVTAVNANGVSPRTGPVCVTA
jgi:hypothetical protein